ncbi:MAG: DEAD/DEAH box helicase [Kiritimatiellae bacterium]|nr:DEAD/DEAH box helicase [Kiritimatiellia bacterium]
MVDASSTNDEKVALFRSLFCGREDVYARRFESAKSGKSGYAPVCRNEWGKGICEKPRIKCGVCGHRAFECVTDDTVRWHLRGKDAHGRRFAMGAYPMLSDERCRFAVMDFDKSSWRNDARTLRQVAGECGVHLAMEISRSGKGAHLWMFLAEAMSAKAVRGALTYIIAVALERHPGLGFDSFDRIIPCQDTMPKGGFGSLVALPLQREARTAGNSVFVDDWFVPFADQWAYLSSLPRTGKDTVLELCRKAHCEGKTILPAQEEKPWEFFMPLWTVGEAVRGDAHPAPTMPHKVVLANRVYIAQDGLPDSVRAALMRIASFANPEFHEAQWARRSAYGKPRIITRALNGEKFLSIPRGCLDAAKEILSNAGLAPQIEDRRYNGVPLEVAFRGELRTMQQDAVARLERFDTGILAAGTAFGKTVVAAWMIARRKSNTLVLVTRRQLQTQWIARLAQFLGVDEREIGCIGGGKDRWTGRIDVALMQSLYRKGHLDSRVKEYGQLIVDECHSIAAETFETIADSAPCRYVLGLSATVERKDKRDPLIMMQCGPVRHRVDARTLARHEPFEHVVRVRATSFKMPVADDSADGIEAYQAVCNAMVENESRNRMIAGDILRAVNEGRSPMVLSERRSHLETLAAMLADDVANTFVLHGGLSAKASRETLEHLAAVPPSAPRVLFSTGSYLGTGFDDSRLDTLFLALPISWKGRLVQYAGRLHRLNDGKREVRIYDYLDTHIALCERMFSRRAKGYAAIGYRMETPLGLQDGWPAEVVLPVEPQWRETFAASILRLCRDGASAGLCDLFVQASLASASKTDAAEAAKSRPAILAFLHRCLATQPGIGLHFERSHRIAAKCGGNPFIEIDLFLPACKLAIMLDDAAMLSDTETYRRARREDALLQQCGCTVLRFLSSDICERLPRILDIIAAHAIS